MQFILLSRQTLILLTSHIRWQNGDAIAVKANGIFEVLVPASGVITFTGIKG